MCAQAIGDAEESIPPELQLQNIRYDCTDIAYEADHRTLAMLC